MAEREPGGPRVARLDPGPDDPPAAGRAWPRPDDGAAGVPAVPGARSAPQTPDAGRTAEPPERGPSTGVAPVADLTAVADRPPDAVADLLAVPGPAPGARTARLDGDAPADRSAARLPAVQPTAEPDPSPASTARLDGAPVPDRQSARTARLDAAPGSRGPRRPGGDPARPSRRPRGGGSSGPVEDGPPDGADPPGAPERDQLERGARSQRDDGRRARGRSARPEGRRRPGPAPIDPDADPVAAAREICLRLLTDRARTREELARALRVREVPDEVAGTVLSRFDEVGLIDDAAFAGQWARSRHRYRGLARRAIAVELRRKGVADEVVGEALDEIDEESEEARARELVDRKLRSLPVDSPERRASAARRLVGMLARKGYPGSIAYRTVREALADHGADDEELGAAEGVDD